MLGRRAHQEEGQDGDEGDLDESDEVSLCPLKDGVQSTIATDSRQRSLDDSLNSLWNESSVMAPAPSRVSALTLLKVAS